MIVKQSQHTTAWLPNNSWKRSKTWPILFFGLLVIAAAWIFLAVQMKYETELSMKNATREGANLALAFEEHVRQVLRQVDQGSLQIKKAVENQEDLTKALSQILDRMKIQPAILRASVFDADGNVILSLPSSPGLINIADRDYFLFHRQNISDEILVNLPIFGRLVHQNIMPISRRINKPDGSFGGIVIVSLHAEYFNNFFKQMELGPDKRIAVVGMDGIVKILQENSNQRAGQDIRNSALYQEVRRKVTAGTLVAYSGIDGLELIHNYRVIPEYGLYVNVAIPVQSVQKELEHRKYNYYLITSLASLFVVAFCAALIRRLQRQYEDARRMSLLQQTTSNLITENSDASALLHMILQDAMALVDAPGGHISMIDQDGKTWTIQFALGMDAVLLGEQHPLENGLTGEVIRAGELRYVADYQSYDAKLTTKDTFTRLTSLIMIPLQHNNRTIGTLSAGWFDMVHHLSDEEMNAFRQYAILAMVALDSSWTRQQVQKLAYTDVLTELPNRRAVYEYLAAELTKSCDSESCGSVLFVDIDELKLVNDAFGHACGDQLLIEAGRRLLGSAGQAAFVGRLSGDEFVVILSGVTDAASIAGIAERLVINLSGAYELNEAMFHVSASVGIASYPTDGKTVGEILKNADAALYAAKAIGKSVWHFYDADLQQETYDTVMLTNSLHHAIEKNELALHYQPQYHIDGRIAGFEALVRWVSEEHGSVSPARFIPLAEKGRLIRSIGEWVLHEACLFAGRLALAGHGGLRIAINVSARQFDFEDFSEIIRTHIAQTSIVPQQLEIEITESAFMESPEACGEQLRKISSMGVSISLDDFGKGYSSLTRLRQLPLKTLKLDKTFIDAIHTDASQPAFISSIVSMAHALGMHVCAEGVEAKEQLERVAACKCDLVQGYYFSKPLPEQQAIKLLEVPSTR